MYRLAKSLIFTALASVPAGCGGDPQAVTDPSKLPPVTREQKEEIRKADDLLAAEEGANPKEPRKTKAAGKPGR